MASDLDHLDAIDDRILRERSRLLDAKTDRERAFREREIASAEKERATEVAFLLTKGIDMRPLALAEILMSDDELLCELSGARGG